MSVKDMILFWSCLTGCVTAFIMLVLYRWAAHRAQQFCRIGDIGIGIAVSGVMIRFVKVVAGASVPQPDVVMLVWGGALVLLGVLIRNKKLSAEMAALTQLRSWFWTTDSAKTIRQESRMEARRAVMEAAQVPIIHGIEDSDEPIPAWRPPPPDSTPFRPFRTYPRPEETK